MALTGLQELVAKIRKETALTDDQIEQELDKILPTAWVPKSVFNEQSENVKKLTKSNEDSAKLLKDLQDKAGLSDEYKKQIDTLKATASKAEEDYKAQIKTMRLNSAMEKALTEAKAKNASQAARLLDTAKITLHDDGTMTGLKEQVEALKKDSSYLFEADESANQARKPAFQMGGGAPNGGQGGADSALFAAFGIAPPKN